MGKETGELETIPEVFVAVADYGLARGVKDLCKKEGCYEAQVDDQWWFALNAHEEPTKCSKGVEVPMFSIYFEFNGFPAGICNPSGGTIAAGRIANEETLLKALRGGAGEITQC